jgi:predicted amidophosphoribosyltransferase
VVLVDDVLTTGATLNACARALLKAGAREVRVLVFARRMEEEKG